MSCPDSICRLVTCKVTDDIPSYLGSYSLQNGFQYVNLAISVPTPTGFYVAPPGTIVINLPPNPVTVSYQGCISTVNEPIPTGSTPAQILAIVADVMSQIAAQSAICNAPPNILNPSAATSFTNGPVSVPCDGDKEINQIGDLPPYVSLTSNGLSIVGGVFSSSISQSDANSIAEAFLLGFFGVSVECGYFNTEQNFVCCDMTTQTVSAGTIFSLVSQADADAQALAQATGACPTCYYNVFTSYTCPDSSVQTVPAGTYMSTVSQAAADALALAAAQAACPATPACQAAINGVSWNINKVVDLVPGTITAVAGVITFNYASTGLNQSNNIIVTGFITNSGATTCTYHIASAVTLNLTPPSVCAAGGSTPFLGLSGLDSFSGAGFEKIWNNSNETPPCTTVVTGPSFPTTFTLPPGNSYEFGFQLTMDTSSQAGSAVSCTGSFTITTP
jgi:Family of unknown function (DUF5977)